MKNILLIATFLFILASCSSTQKKMDKFSALTPIGMSESDFVLLLSTQNMRFTQDNSVYRVERTKGRGTAVRYFYFENGRLSKIDDTKVEKKIRDYNTGANAMP